MKNISLEGKFVELIPDEKENIDVKNLHTGLAIKDMKSGKILGKIYSYQYNQIDDYIYFSVEIEKDVNSDVVFEACNIFFNYLFTCFPIRKIYYEGNCYCIEVMKELKKIGFKVEANLKKDYFCFGEYCDRYILALYRNNFCEGN